MALMRDDRPDQDLLSATRRGNAEAFAEIYRRHYRLVLAYLIRRVRDPELAADLTGETFARALLAAHKGRQARNDTAAPWLLGIARHTMLDSIRQGQAEDRARRRLGMQTVALSDEEVDMIAEIGSNDGLMRLARELPAKQRDALIARVIDERDYPEIAEELQCSEIVVRQRVSRALSILRDRAGDTA